MGRGIEVDLTGELIGNWKVLKRIDKFAEVSLFNDAGRLDATSIANPGYTLMNTMYIIPKG